MAVSGRAHAPANADPMAGVDVAANGTAWRDAAVDMVVWAVREEDVGAETGALECDALRAFDAASGGAVRAMIEEGEFKGKVGTSAFSRAIAGTAKHVGVVGVGKRGEATTSAMLTLGSAAAAQAQKSKCKTLGIKGADGFENAVAAGAYLGATEDQRFKSKPQAKTLESVSLLDVSADVSEGKARAVGVQLTKDLVAAPPNVVTPTAMAEVAKSIAAAHPDCMSVKILEKADCEKLGMGSFLGVSEASDEPPKFIHLTYKGAGSDLKKVAVVGKGLTFDSGGYNLKAGAGSMIEMMKFDMGGSGATLGAAKIIAQTKPAGVECHFIIASCENMIGSRGLRPGDILTASNGKTIEVNNTDAEGRLTLADALVYADKTCGATAIVDCATLTGAIIVALGNDIAGLFSPKDAAAKRVEDAAKAAGEDLWRMPMPDSMWSIMKSEIADMKNTGSRGGGSITAALFLKQFVDESVEWSHVDLAGPVWDDKKGGATGYGAALFAAWVSSFKK
jgi:leucyl aminopeptidase|tara:strand:+ start:7533 stop:9053 length:1521 start_codon:yes stop_codon:yes gene_type:complete